MIPEEAAGIYMSLGGGACLPSLPRLRALRERRNCLYYDSVGLTSTNRPEKCDAGVRNSLGVGH